MPNYTVTLTDAQDKSLSYEGDVEEWIKDAVKGLAGSRKRQIINDLIEHCNDNDIAIASGESAQIDQAISLGITKVITT